MIAWYSQFHNLVRPARQIEPEISADGFLSVAVEDVAPIPIVCGADCLCGGVALISHADDLSTLDAVDSGMISAVTVR